MLKKHHAVRSSFAALIVLMGCVITPALAKKPHGGGHGHKSHGFGHVSIGPYGFGVGYQNKHFGVNVGPFLAGFADEYQPFPGAGFVEPALLPPGPPPGSYGAYEVRQPLPPQLQEGTLVPTRAARFQFHAEAAFRQGQYHHAFRFSQHAQLDDPHNGKLQLFMSQVLLALGDYPAATAALEAGIADLVPSDWGYVVVNIGRFSRNADYVMHMNRLVHYIDEHPGAAFARLLRGYHYMYLGHARSARMDLNHVVAQAVNENNVLARRLLDELDAKSPALAQPAPLPAPVEALPTPIPIPAD